MKTAIITGVTGQDGGYLADLLLSAGYAVHGVVNPKRDKAQQLSILKSRGQNIKLHFIDISQPKHLNQLIAELVPDEIYHLASDLEQRLIKGSELFIFENNFLPGVNILNAVLEYSDKTKVFMAGSSLMFGQPTETPQNEKTPMCPNTPYGIAKVAMLNFLTMYRDYYGLFCVCGIFYNHESPRRNNRTLPKKIANAAARIYLGKQKVLKLGNLEAERDWSFAGDVVQCAWAMLQSEKPKDYVIGSGKLHSVRSVLEIAFSEVGLRWQDHVEIDLKLLRQVELTQLCADSSQAALDLGWSARMEFNELIRNMVRSDLGEENG